MKRDRPHCSTTETPRDQITPAERLAAVAAVFREHCAIEITAAEAHGIAFLLSRIATAPRGLYDDPEYAAAMKAARLLADSMPGLIRHADALAARARNDGIPSSLDQFAENGRALLAAIEPFNVARRDHRGWWHGWAAQLAQQTAWVLMRRGVRPNFSLKTAPAVLATVALLRLAGHDVAAPAMVDALKQHRRKSGANRKRGTSA